MRLLDNFSDVEIKEEKDISTKMDSALIAQVIKLDEAYQKWLDNMKPFVLYDNIRIAFPIVASYNV